jgi:hypothetical protein
MLSHGEAAATAALAALLAAESDGGWPPILRPSLGNRIVLDPGRPAKLDGGVGRLQDAKLAEADWHNAQSGFLLELADTLRRAPSDQTRMALLRRLRGALDGR